MAAGGRGRPGVRFNCSCWRLKGTGVCGGGVRATTGRLKARAGGAAPPGPRMPSTLSRRGVMLGLLKTWVLLGWAGSTVLPFWPVRRPVAKLSCGTAVMPLGVLRFRYWTLLMARFW